MLTKVVTVSHHKQGSRGSLTVAYLRESVVVGLLVDHVPLEVLVNAEAGTYLLAGALALKFVTLDDGEVASSDDALPDIGDRI